MITVIGKKQNYAVGYFTLGVIYFLLGGGMAVISALLWRQAESARIALISVSVLAFPVSVWGFAHGVYLLRYPKDLIAVTESSVVLLKTNAEIPFSHIESIACKRARSRGGLLSFGAILIRTADGRTIKQPHVADAESVCAILKNLAKSI